MRLKLVITCLFFCLQGLCYCEDNWLKFSGETNYSKSSSEELSTTLKVDFKFKIHEPSHKRWGLFLTGNVSPDYDVFQKVLKINTFQALSLEF